MGSGYGPSGPPPESNPTTVKIQATHSTTLPVPSRADRSAPRPMAGTAGVPSTTGEVAPRTGSVAHALRVPSSPMPSHPWPSHRHSSPLAHYEATAALPATTQDYEVVGIDLYA